MGRTGGDMRQGGEVSGEEITKKKIYKRDG